jgi:chaperonin GroEL
MRKEIIFGKDARSMIYVGVKKVSDAVCVTLGPMGRTVIINKSMTSPNGMQYFQPIVSRDGVTVARSIMLTEFIENTGCLMIREASERTMSSCGDGTSTTCLFVEAILREGLVLIESGANPQEIKKEIDIAVNYVVSELKKMAIPVGDGVDRIRQIATVSANNDSSIGNLIADAFDKIGKDGIISIEESKNEKTEIKIIDGFEFDRGWLSMYFINEQAKMTCEMNDAYILLYDKKLYQIEPLEKILFAIAKSQKPVLIICDDADGQALAIIQANVKQGSLKACIVRSPGFGDSKLEEMEDLAVLTGAEYISDEKGISLSEMTMKHLGHADKVVVSKDKTTIVGYKKKQSEFDDLVANLRMNITQSSDAEKEKIEKRIAKLSSGVAVLYVGAATETEMKERKDRCDDAVRATKAAISEGIICGGGTAFLNIHSQSSIINSVLQAPLKQICSNAGVDWGTKHSEILKRGSPNIGYNAKSDTIEDLVSAGIIDPVKVLRCSLENAASTATLILTSEALICDTL